MLFWLTTSFQVLSPPSGSQCTSARCVKYQLLHQLSLNSSPQYGCLVAAVVKLSGHISLTISGEMYSLISLAVKLAVDSFGLQQKQVVKVPLKGDAVFMMTTEWQAVLSSTEQTSRASKAWHNGFSCQHHVAC